ncbi:MAG: murein biosynthesis integral membrane protein MurJ [Xanthobacteraceae bacterium]
MSLARRVATVSGITLLSRVLGFARDVLIAAVFGAGIRADAFFVAFQLANLVRRLMAEGALNAAVVPLYLRARDKGGEAAAGAFAGQLIGTLAVGLAGAALVLALAMPAIVFLLAPGFAWYGPRMILAVELARLMLPYLAFAGPLAVLMGVLNANHRFAFAALATAAFNATMLAALFVIFMQHGGESDFSGRVLAASVALAGLAQLVLVGAGVWIGPERVTPLSLSFGPHMRRFLALAIPGLVASGIPQITLIAGVMVASASRNAVSWLYYANRLIELPLGIVGIAIGTVLVPAFAHALRSKDRAELVAAESRGLELALGLALPAAVALVVLAEPIIAILFERGAFTPFDTAATAAALAAFAWGLPGHVLVKAFSPVFFAREDTATPMNAALVGFVIALLGSLALWSILGHVGVAIATSVSGWATAGMLGALIARRIGFSLDRDALRRLPRIGLAALIMGFAIQALKTTLAPWLGGAGLERVLALGILVGGGFAVYAALLHVLGVARLRDLTTGLRRKL